MRIENTPASWEGCHRFDRHCILGYPSDAIRSQFSMLYKACKSLFATGSGFPSHAV